jgi:predicted homoserine dehydrogenase-like protein
VLDGEGGYTVYGKVMPAAESLRIGGLPLGLAHRAPLRHAIAAGQPVRWVDVEIDEDLPAVVFRRAMETTFVV